MNMLKKIFLMLICLVLLVSCKSNENGSVIDTPTLIPEATPPPEPTPEPATSLTNPAWVEAYADFFMTSDCPPYFILLDVDFDDIPELFLYTSGYGANTWVVSIIRYLEQGLEKIDIEEQIPAQFELYKEKQTGETRWMMVQDSFRSSFAYYHYEWRWIDFNDFHDIRTEFFFKWDNEGIITDDETDEYERIYYLYDNADDMKEAEYEEIERRQKELFLGYELMQTQELYGFVNDFVINEGELWDDKELDRSLLVEFLLRWSN